MTGRLVVAGCLFVAVLVGLSAAFAYKTSDTVTATVTKTERVAIGESSHKYLVFTDDEILQNTDSLWYLKFDSSDLHGMLEEGRTYSFAIYGWRVPFLSMYRNIVSAELQ